MPIGGGFSSGGGGGAAVDLPPLVYNGAAIAGGGTLDEITIAEAGAAERTVTTLFVVPTSDVTANNTNYVTFSWFLRGDDGVATDQADAVTKVSGAGSTGDLTAYVRETVAVSWTVPAGGRITFTAASTGTGAMPRAAYGVIFD